MKIILPFGTTGGTGPDRMRARVADSAKWILRGKGSSPMTYRTSRLWAKKHNKQLESEDWEQNAVKVAHDLV